MFMIFLYTFVKAVRCADCMAFDVVKLLNK